MVSEELPPPPKTNKGSEDRLYSLIIVVGEGAELNSNLPRGDWYFKGRVRVSGGRDEGGKGG